jgi:O-antigen ligase
VRRLDRSLDAMGIGIASLAVGWAFLVSAVSGGSAWPFVGLMAAALGTLTFARALERLRPRSTAFVVLVTTIGVFLAGWLLSGDWGNPLGYANGSAALAVQASIAGAVLAVHGSPSSMRVVGCAGVLLFGVTPFALEARTAGLLALGLVASIVLGSATRWPRRGVAVGAALLTVCVGATIVLGAAHHRGESGSIAGQVVDESLSATRVALWHDALVISAHHPLTGVGWGGFATTSPIARSDPDLRHAHNDFLQQAAEAGVPGLVLMVLLFGWGFARLYVSRAPDAVVLFGAIALTALGVGASVDYVLHFTAVVMSGAALVGAAQAAPLARDAREAPPAPVRTGLTRDGAIIPESRDPSTRKEQA